MTSPAETAKAKAALDYILPLLAKHNIRWVMTGGFACYAYGVERPLTDIDIDMDVGKDEPQFKAFYAEIEPYITSPLEHIQTAYYDNYNFEATVGGVILDFCPMADLMVFDQNLGKHVHLYQDGFPDHEVVTFEGHALTLLSKPLVIANKEMTAFGEREPYDKRDMAGLRELMK